VNELNLYGPPGTGKTTRLTRLALSSVRTLGGADRLGAVTYTRAAAYELRGRIAAALGVAVPTETGAARRVLERAVPWVGTIHSLCYRLLGRPPAISGKDLTEFAHSVDPRSKLKVFVPTNPDDVEGFEYSDVASQDEIELALQLHAMARHRMIPMEQAFRLLSSRSPVLSSPERLEGIAVRYEAYKNEIGKIDFEDMLSMGREIPLPVSVLLSDEVQDNSALLWSVIDSWAESVDLLVNAGDPWQAIYLFSGASPDLFRGRTGRWVTIGNSHRLSAASATYALDLLRYSGYAEDSLLSTWTGVGGMPKEEGSRFFLARTNRLLSPIREMLEDRGVPYRLLRGTGPLQMKAAQAFRAWHKEGSGESPISVATAALIADQAPAGRLPRGYKAAWERLAKEAPDTLVTEPDMEYIRNAIDGIYNWDYYERVLKQYGLSAFILPAKTAVGTIHAAKGREADEVSLVRSWGYLPGRAMSESLEGRLAEACVAYVGATRHRTRLSLIDGMDGIPYPFTNVPVDTPEQEAIP
jgi:superfamily I DNA/RNA helicase